MKNLAGIYVAALTPLHADLRCHYQEFVNHCTALINKGCNGVVLFGTTGEGCSFSVQERGEAIAELIKQGVDPQKMIICVSSPAIEDAVTLIRISLKHNCTTVLILPPFFYKQISDEGIVAYYSEIIKRINDSSFKILLYHIPKYSGVSISLKVIESLRNKFPSTVVGIKDSDGDINFTKQILTQFPGFKVFVGNEVQLSDAVRLGAAGSISGLANIYPELICSLYEFGRNSNIPDENENFKNLVSIIKNYPFVPAIKCLIGKNTVRPPLVSLKSDEREKLIQALKNASKKFK